MSALQSFKDGKIAEIRTNTERLIEQGFVFDGLLFNLDRDSREKWLALKTLESSMVWPVTVSSAATEYLLTQASLPAFLLAALAVVQGYKDSGRALRLQVAACADVPSVFAVEDSRS